MEDKRTFFKEIVILFVLVLVMSSLVGCSENKAYTPKPDADMIFHRESKNALSNHNYRHTMTNHNSEITRCIIEQATSYFDNDIPQ